MSKVSEAECPTVQIPPDALFTLLDLLQTKQYFPTLLVDNVDIHTRIYT